ncbi:MAG: tRNA-guanine transglycosylase DpdA [Candidatus Bathyarchaeia archaeon]
MKYFLPEWNNTVDPAYDFIKDTHSPEHREDPVKNDVYIWDIFGLSDAPIDGLLISRTIIMENKRKYEWALKEGIHRVLHLPKNFEIMGDCGAFGYIEEKIPPFDPIETLRYYRDLGFNYGVTVDHLVVPQFKKEKDFRMRITYEYGIKSYEVWLKNFKNDFQLIVAVQGWEIKDYIKMYENYLKHGIRHFGFGGLVRSPTSFILDLLDQLIERIKETKILPEYLHFFGLARIALFPKFKELEDLGVPVGFDSASFLRKAWLSSPTSQLNYLSLDGEGYTAIRVPFVGRRSDTEEKMLNKEHFFESLISLEQECLEKLRMYDRGEIDLESVLQTLSKFNKAIGERPELIRYYRRLLEDRPWKSCDCPVCKNIGIDVVIFRGNNRNMRRGFHNTYVFYKVLRNPELWPKFVNKEGKEENILTTLKKGEKVLVITECTKEKLGYDSSVRAPARQMYQGRLFKAVRKYCETMGFDYVIISAKYGLLHPDEVIEGYEMVLKTKEDVERIRPQVEEKLHPILKNYDKIVVIAGKQYREVLKNLWDERFIAVKSRGYGDLCNIVSKATAQEITLLNFI